MKLFKSFLVAPAALGLIAPMSANATEVNLNEISNYSDVESIEFANSFNNDKSTLNPLLAGGEGLVDDHSHDDGSFSETTTASFSADFYVGATDTDDGSTTADDKDDSIMAGYGFQIDLNTSFTGEDSLDISIDGGNASGAGYAEFDGNATSDYLKLDGVSYTFPVGGVTAFVGDNTDGSLLFTTACVYGGPSNTLDDCGNVFAGITGGALSAGASYDFGNGFTAATGLQTSTTGVLTVESNDSIAFNVAYTSDSYGVSLAWADIEGITTGVNETTVYALNAYYVPEADGMPSISVGYESAESEIPSYGTADTDSSGWFVGLSWDEVGPGTAGIAVGTKQHTLDQPGEANEEMLMYEAYYAYPVNDGMTITPLVFMKENAVTGTDDETGAMVKTSFSF